MYKYILQKNLPDSKAGDVYVWIESMKAYYKDGDMGNSYWVPENVQNNTEWFKPQPELEWEVIAIRGIRSGYIYNRRGNIFFKEDDLKIDNYPDGDHGCEIYSMKRVKDGEVWIIKNYDKNGMMLHPNISRDLDTIKEERNILAHQELDITEFKDAILANKSVFKKFKNKVYLIEYDEKKYQDHILLINRYAHFFFNSVHLFKTAFPPDPGTPSNV